MKTKLSVLLAFVLIAQASMAQFSIGIKGGANITKIDGQAFRDEFRYGYILVVLRKLVLAVSWVFSLKFCLASTSPA